MQKLGLFYLILAFFLACSPSSDPVNLVPPGGGNGTGGTGGTGSDGTKSLDLPGVVNGEVKDADLALVSYALRDVITPRVNRLHQLARQFNQGVQSACTDSNGISRDELIGQWENLAKNYHFLEMFQMGPLDRKTKSSLVTLYSPSIKGASQAIDGQIQVAATQGENYKMGRKQPFLLGLDAFEYVLFSRLEGVDTVTSSVTECTYMQFVARDMEERFTAMEESWTLYLEDFASPNGQSLVRDKYLTDLVTGVYFFYEGTTETKLLRPIGKLAASAGECGDGICVDRYMEYPYARYMVRSSVEENINALAEIMGGATQTQAFGFQDWFDLKSKETTIVNPPFAPEVMGSDWQRVTTEQDLTGLFTKSEKGQGDVDFDQVVESFRVYSRWLKASFAINMSVGVPGNVQGDND